MPTDAPINAPVVPDANAQAKAALPKPEYMAPGEDLLQGTKVQKAYDAAQNFLGEHAQHFSDKVLKPFREELDRMGEGLQTAGETGRTPTGGQLTEPTRALASGVGTLLKQVPVGKDVKETLQMAATDLPKLPEGHIFSHIEGVRPLEELISEDAVRVKGVTIPPERDTGVFHEHIKKGGAVPGGIQKGDAEIGVPDLALFHDPATGSTLALPTDKISPENVQKQIQTSRKQYLAAKEKVEPKQVAKNASGDSAASQEALNREKSEKNEGVKYLRIHSKSKIETPLSSIDGVDAKPGPHDWIVKRTKTGDILQDSGEKAGPFSRQPSKTETAKPAAPKIGQKQKVSKEDSKLASDYLASLKKPIAYGSADKEPENKSRIVIEGIDEPAKNPEGKYSDKNKYDPWSPNYKKRAGAPEPIKRA
jgi:hypothetical protein